MKRKKRSVDSKRAKHQSGVYVTPQTDEMPLTPLTSNCEQGAPVTIEQGEFVPYDENLLERARTQWQFGDWDNLVKLQRDSIEHHPERAKLALLVAAGHQQTGDITAVREFVQLALEWGCDKKLISRVLVAGVYNILGKAAAIGGQQDKTLGLFEESVRLGEPGGELRLITKARTTKQLGQISQKRIAPHHVLQPTINERLEFQKAKQQWFVIAKRMINYSIPSLRVKHDLPAPLIISLTSYPDRYECLPLTLNCLLSQTVMPDKIILWIGYQDQDLLTDDILSFRQKGIAIQFCENIGSYKKIIPTLQNYPDSYIVTADDDTYYPATWLEKLVITSKNNTTNVIAHRVRRIELDNQGKLLPYEKWAFELDNLSPSPLNFPTGVGGVLYPPHVFHPDVLKSNIFMKLCPTGDDIWLYWMWQIKGAMCQLATKTKDNTFIVNWPESQKNSLWAHNQKGQNDQQINKMIGLYGFPVSANVNKLK